VSVAPGDPDVAQGRDPAATDHRMSPSTRSQSIPPRSRICWADPVGAGEQGVRAALCRVSAADGWVRAFLQVTADDAVANARELDQAIQDGHAPGPWSGVPIAVKGPTGMTSAQTRRLRAAGAIPIGTTSVPRGPGPQTWGHTDRGPTRNPWRPDLTPGGSSAGSAAAVAAGFVDVATGSDGAGSARIPAAWCGIYGYKPTTALTTPLDRAGLAVPAPLTRDPRDLARWAHTVLGPLPAAPVAATAAWSADLGYAADQLDDEVVTLAHTAARRLADTAGLRWSTSDVGLTDPARAWTALRDPAASTRQRRAADAVRTGNNQRLQDVFAATDVLFTPTTPGRPHPHSGPGEHMSVALTWAFNLSGHPAVSVPAGRTRDGTPVGLQIIARPRADATLLTLAAHLPPAPTAPPATRAGETHP
jgi:amidase